MKKSDLSGATCACMLLVLGAATHPAFAVSLVDIGNGLQQPVVGDYLYLNAENIPA